DAGDDPSEHLGVVVEGGQVASELQVHLAEVAGHLGQAAAQDLDVLVAVELELAERLPARARGRGVLAALVAAAGRVGRLGAARGPVGLGGGWRCGRAAPPVAAPARRAAAQRRELVLLAEALDGL